MRLFQAHVQSRVRRVRFSPDAGTLTLVVQRYPMLAHFQTATGQRQLWHPLTLQDTPTELAYSPNGEILVVGCRNGSVFPFRIADEALSHDPVLPFRHIHAEPLARLLVVDNTPRWRVHGPIRHESEPFPSAGQVTLSAVNFSPTVDPARMRLVAAGTHLYIWNPHAQEHILAEDLGDYRGAAFGPDGSFVASIEHHAHTLTAWTVKPFRARFRTELTGIGDFANGSLAVLPDGERIVYAAGDQLRCVSMSGGPGWETAVKKPVLDLALHPNGRSVLTADGSKKVTQFDTLNGRPIQQFDWGIGKVSCVDISADGTLAAAGGEKGQVAVWDTE